MLWLLLFGLLLAVLLILALRLMPWTRHARPLAATPTGPARGPSRDRTLRGKARVRARRAAR